MDKKIKIRTNLVFGILACITGIILFLIIPSQVKISKYVTEFVNGRCIPYVIAGIMVGCGAISIFKSLVFKKDDIKEIVVGKEARIIFYFLVLIVYLFLADKVSFLGSSILLGNGTLVLFKCKKPLKYFIVNAIIVAICLTFYFALNVNFGGIWGI